MLALLRKNHVVVGGAYRKPWRVWGIIGVAVAVGGCALLATTHQRDTLLPLFETEAPPHARPAATTSNIPPPDEAHHEEAIVPEGLFE